MLSFEVLVSTATAPKSSLLLGTVTVAVGTGAITAAMITQGAKSQHPALVDPANGYVDKQTNDTTTSIAPKRVSKLAVGSQPTPLGSNIQRFVGINGWILNSGAGFVAVPFNNTPADNALNLADDGWMYQFGPQYAGLVMPAGYYRLTASFVFGQFNNGSIDGAGIRAMNLAYANGWRIASVSGAAAYDRPDYNPYSLSATWYHSGNDVSNPVQVQLWQNSGYNMIIPGPGLTPASQCMVIERLS